MLGVEPALGVASTERDQLVDELASEEQVAEQLAVDRAALRVDDPPEQREVGVAHETADAGVVTLVDIARKASDLQAIARRDEDVGNPSAATSAGAFATGGRPGWERLVNGGERRDIVGELIGEHDLQ